MSKKPKPHENGVIVQRYGGESWHWAATPAEARRRYAERIEWFSSRLPTSSVRIQRIEMGHVVEETTLGRERN